MRAFLNTVAFERAVVFMGIFDRDISPWDISCSALQKGWPSLLKVISSGAFLEDFALPLMSVSAFMPQYSSNS